MVENLSNVERRVTAVEVMVDGKADKEAVEKLERRVTSLGQSRRSLEDAQKLQKRVEDIEQNQLDMETGKEAEGTGRDDQEELRG